MLHITNINYIGKCRDILDFVLVFEFMSGNVVSIQHACSVIYDASRASFNIGWPWYMVLRSASISTPFTNL